jgi:hypothetical protein
MTTKSPHAGRIFTTLVAGSCGLLAFAYPNWRTEAQGQGYEAGPPFPAPAGRCWFFESGIGWQLIIPGLAEAANISVTACGPSSPPDQTPITSPITSEPPITEGRPPITQTPPPVTTPPQDPEAEAAFEYSDDDEVMCADVAASFGSFSRFLRCALPRLRRPPIF